MLVELFVFTFVLTERLSLMFVFTFSLVETFVFTDVLTFSALLVLLIVLFDVLLTDWFTVLVDTSVLKLRLVEVETLSL